jgi:hypothetical protein
MTGSSTFQKTVNYFNPLGFVGGFAFQGPTRAIAANVNSNGTANLFGNAYTFTASATADPTNGAANGATVQVGGSGVFAGILFNPKENVLTGVTGNPLGASISLADNSVGELLQMGYTFVNLPGPANPGDLVTYDPLTGNLNSITPTTAFTGAIAPGGSAGVADTLTVTLLTAGSIQVGMVVTGAGVAGGTVIAAVGTGLGGNGTYTLNTINEQTVSAELMTGNNLPAPAFAVSSGYIVGTTLTVTTVTSGELAIGQQVFGTGVLPNTVITAILTGHGGAGTYTINNTQTVFSSGTPGAFTGPSNLFVPTGRVERYATNSTGGGVAVIKLTQ